MVASNLDRRLTPWVVGLLCFAGGYLLRWWLASEFQDAQGEEEGVPRRRRSRRRAAPPEEVKLVLVVNDSLKMGKGKIGAQCAHAAVGMVDRIMDSHPDILASWEAGGQPKICLKAKDDVELRSLAAAAAKAGLPTFIVHDAGRTQVAAGSRTVLAVGPAQRSDIDRITGHLKLL